MAITRPKPPTAHAFVQGAPDAARKGVLKGKREQITLTIVPDLLARVDDYAAKRGQSRAAMINMAIYEFVQRNAEPVDDRE